MKDFKKYYILDAPPQEVYEALTNAVSIRLWTNEDAVMEPTTGTEFSLWDGSITGKNIEFIENKKIVQQWYFGDKDESIVTIKLHSHGESTSVELRHTNIPDDDYDEIVEGWNESYFGNLEEFFG